MPGLFDGAGGQKVNGASSALNQAYLVESGESAVRGYSPAGSPLIHCHYLQSDSLVVAALGVERLCRVSFGFLLHPTSIGLAGTSQLVIGIGGSCTWS